MIQDLLSPIVLFTIFVFSILLAFTPAIIELKKPQDAGPRRIKESCIYQSGYSLAFVSAKEKKTNSQLSKQISSLLEILPNLESTFIE
jgi:hypothetical protein